eukprot:INCI8248.2.p1 GENE.INCI8248.2~~INCI8248.2.p1  ORF type:complete len:340 (-),score=51.77 INCI8248.2:223-1242(-)
MSQDFISLFPFQNAEHWINVDDPDDSDDEAAGLQALSSGTLGSLSPAEQIKYLVDTIDEDIVNIQPAAHQHIVRAFARVASRHSQLFHLATASSVNPDVFEDENYASKFDKFSGTYGEITMRGVDVVFKAMHKVLISKFGNQYDPHQLHLFDLGSGVGKVPIQAVLGGHFTRATGIELSPRRHRVAELCLSEIVRGNTKAVTKNCTTKASLEPGSICFLEADVSRHWTYGEQAGAAYISNLLFGDKLNATVGKCLQHCQQLQVVVSILSIPLREDYYRLHSRVPLYVSWQDEPMQGFLYVRVGFSQLPPSAAGIRSLSGEGAGPQDELRVAAGLYLYRP